MLYRVKSETSDLQDVNSPRFNKWKMENVSRFALLKAEGPEVDEALLSIFATAVEPDKWPELDLQRVKDARDKFRTFYRDGNHLPSFYLDLEVKWDDLVDKVNEVNTNPVIPLNDLALRLIHRYEIASNRWFLTVQLCVIGQTPTPSRIPEIFNIYDLTNTDKYFHILPKSINDNPLGDYVAGDLEGTVNNHSCNEYFANAHCDSEAVVFGTHVQSAVFIWNEFIEMYNDNQIPTRPDKPDFSIVFASCSYNATEEESFVAVPHSVLSYLKYKNVACLADGGFLVGDFTDKAGDFNTLCPRRCAQVAYPKGHFPGR